MTLALNVYVPATGDGQDTTPLVVYVIPAGGEDVFQVKVVAFGFVEVSVAVNGVPAVAESAVLPVRTGALLGALFTVSVY